MATPSRVENPPVESRRAQYAEIERVIRKEPYSFDFFQAVRLLGRILADRQPVGRFSIPRTEVVRFGAGADFGFPPSQIAGLDWPENGQPQMLVNFMGLTGPHGVMPLYYSALVRERMRARDGAIREFLDVFNHRIVSLFYQAWEKFRFTVAYERGDDDRLSQRLLDLLGLGTAGLRDRQKVPDVTLIFRCGLLAAQARSAVALRALLMDYFEVPVEIEQFVGAWHSLEPDMQCRFSDTPSYSEQLGMGAVVGDEIWDQQSTARIRLGPLTLDQYRGFLPDGSAHEPLRALVRFFAGNELDFEVQLVLRKEETPGCELGGEGPAGPRLGWLTWAKTKTMRVDPDDGVLRI